MDPHNSTGRALHWHRKGLGPSPVLGPNFSLSALIYLRIVLLKNPGDRENSKLLTSKCVFIGEKSFFLFITDVWELEEGGKLEYPEKNNRYLAL